MKPPRREQRPTGDTEPTWPGAVALLAAASLKLFLPDSLGAGPGWPSIAVIALLAVCAHLSPRYHRQIGFTAAAVATFELGRALVALIFDLTSHKGQPADLLQAALVLWSMNVVVFASWYWRLDAGGPRKRAAHGAYCGGAFLFPQLTMPDDARHSAGADDWRPGFIDYLFLAFNTSTAFSPTDAPVLSAWAKVLMMVQSSISLATLAMVAARAVNIL